MQGKSDLFLKVGEALFVLLEIFLWGNFGAQHMSVGDKNAPLPPTIFHFFPLCTTIFMTKTRHSLFHTHYILYDTTMILK